MLAGRKLKNQTPAPARAAFRARPGKALPLFPWGADNAGPPA